MFYVFCEQRWSWNSFFFFFSSRRRHTRSLRDWSSDVCSSDLGLLGEVDPISAKHLVRITTGKMRLGIGDPTVLDALSFARRGDRSLRPMLEAAYNRTSDLGLIARTLWAGDESAVEALTVTVGRPIRSQLAERLPDPEAVIKRLGLVGVQPKYDGFRVQIHRDGERVS